MTMFESPGEMELLIGVGGIVFVVLLGCLLRLYAAIREARAMALKALNQGNEIREDLRNVKLMLDKLQGEAYGFKQQMGRRGK